MSSVGFLIFDGLWREISARVNRFVRSASEPNRGKTSKSCPFKNEGIPENIKWNKACCFKVKTGSKINCPALSSSKLSATILYQLSHFLASVLDGQQTRHIQN